MNLERRRRGKEDFPGVCVDGLAHHHRLGRGGRVHRDECDGGGIGGLEPDTRPAACTGPHAAPMGDDSEVRRIPALQLRKGASDEDNDVHVHESVLHSAHRESRECIAVAADSGWHMRHMRSNGPKGLGACVACSIVPVCVRDACDAVNAMRHSKGKAAIAMLRGGYWALTSRPTTVAVRVHHQGEEIQACGVRNHRPVPLDQLRCISLQI